MILEHKGMAKKFAKFNLRYGRGNGHFSFIINAFKMVVYYGGFAYLMEEWFGFEIPKEVGIVGAVVYIFACYFIGLLDEKIGFWKQEASYSIQELNPPLKKMVDQVENIFSKINSKGNEQEKS